MADSQGAELHAASDKTSQIYAKLPSTQAIGKLDRVAAAGCSYVGLKATVRYDFVAEGPEELDLTKGQIVKILDMGADDGWWEGECEGDVGIFPESYVEIIEDYKPEPAIEHTSHLDPQDTAGSMGDGSSQTQLVTKPSVGIAPVMPARRENFGAADSLRKSYNPVNRMSSFVKMGAEEYILGNSRVIADVKDDMSIKAGPSWHDRKPFIVEIGAPRSEKKYHGMKSYISYTLTPSDTNILVRRRYKHFDWLYSELKRKYTFIAIPPLPPKQLTGIFEEDFVHRRMNMLQQWLNRMCAHPILQQSPSFQMFIRTEQDSAEWKKDKRDVENDPLREGSLFASVRAPNNNLPENVDSEMSAFKEYIKGLTHSSDAVNKQFDDFAEFGAVVSREHQKLADAMMLLAKPPTEGLMTACWRATCAADTRATRGIMVTSQAFDAIGQMSKRNYPRHVQMVSDITKEYTRMIPQYENIADAQALASHKANDAMAGLAEGKLEVSYSNAVQDRYEVISNIALAEANNFHAYKEKDFKAMMERFLDGQIDHYKEVLTKLEKAREAIEEL